MGNYIAVNKSKVEAAAAAAVDDFTIADVDLEKLKKDVERPIVLQKFGIRTWAGKMEKIVFTSTIREIGERFNFQKLLARSDYDTESTQAGNRDINEGHWKKIQEFLETDERPYLGMAVVAMAREDAEIQLLEQIDDGAYLAKLTVRSDAARPIILDWQHRERAAFHAWAGVRDLDSDTATEEQLELKERLENTSVVIEMLFEHERDVLSTIFVNMGTTRPISKDVIAVMDQGKIQNRLGAAVVQKSDLLRRRTTYLGAKAARQLAEKHGRDYEPLYKAGNAVDAAAMIAGVGVRDRTPDQREEILKRVIKEKKYAGGKTLSEADAIDAVATEIAALLDYAYKKLPGWSELSRGTISVSDFSDTYVHSTAAGLKVIAIVLAAARAAGVSAHRAIDVMAKESFWRRDALRDGKDAEGNPAKVHVLFQGTLVKTFFDEKTEQWKSSTMGARRDLYQSAADKVLRLIAVRDPSLAQIASLPTYEAVGLASSAGRGRPKKAVAE